MSKPRLHVDVFQNMMLIVQDSPTLHSNTHDAIDKAIGAGWYFDDNYVVDGRYYIVMTMPYNAEHEAVYAEHIDALTMMQWYGAYMDEWNRRCR